MVKLVHISDTHLRPFNPEPGDILVHSGDALLRGDISELSRFKKQLKPLRNKYKHIILTPGNHDWIFQLAGIFAADYLKEGIPNLHVLIDNGIKLDGSSHQPFFCNWAFNEPDSMKLYGKYNNIPDDVNVLITHCPAKGVLDNTMRGERVGSDELRLHMPRFTKLKAHLHGHIHWSHGIHKINDVFYSNASICDESYSPTNKENVMEIE